MRRWDWVWGTLPVAWSWVTDYLRKKNEKSAVGIAAIILCFMGVHKIDMNKANKYKKSEIYAYFVGNAIQGSITAS